MSTVTKYCCKGLERLVTAPDPDDKFIIAPSGKEWFIYDKEIKDTYPLDECIFCGAKLL